MDRNEKNGKSNVATYGGGENRLIYEGKKKSANDRFILILIIFASVLVAFLAIIGLVSLIGGTAFKTITESETHSGIKVPTNAEISNQSNIESIIASSENGIVLIKTTFNNGTSSSQSGFFISSDGIIATEMTNSITRNDISDITVYYGVGKTITADISGNVPSLGMTFLQIESEVLATEVIPSLDKGNSSYVKSGQQVWAVPSSREDFVGFSVHGSVSAVSKKVFEESGEMKTYALIYTDFEMNPSLAGAPLIDSNGEIIGMCSTYIDSSVKGIGVVIPINTVVLIGNEMLNSK